MRTMLIMTALALGSCSQIPGTSANLEARSRDVLSDTLFDADSARFRNLRSVADGKGSMICGEVNAKNKIGSYIGFRNFMVSRDERFGIVDPQSDITDPRTERQIQEKAYQDGFNAAWPGCSK